MPGDFSRSSFTWSPRYSGVLMQQGRVQLDADWNEQVALTQHRTHAEAYDVIGMCGAPKAGSGFKLVLTPAGDDFFILPGRYYAGGLLCEIDPEWLPLSSAPTPSGPAYTLPSAFAERRPWQAGEWAEVRSATGSSTRVQIASLNPPSLQVAFGSALPLGFAAPLSIRRAYTYFTQPFYPAPDNGTHLSSPPNFLSSPPNDKLQLPSGEYLAYLEAWQREVNFLEDPHLREVALGKPDTAVRVQTVWQVRLLSITADVSAILQSGKQPACDVVLPSWSDLIAKARTTGTLNARSVPEPPGANPCSLPPDAGYTGLENQLYRVEIFRGGPTLTACSFVWSRDNASVETSVVSVDPTNPAALTVASLGDDDLHSFSVGDWVELVSRDGELESTPRFLAQIVAPAPDPSLNVITLNRSVPDPAAIADEDTGNRFRLRRWEVTGASVTSDGIAMSSAWIALEDGVQVQFSEGTYAPRAYWLIPARTVTADVEWPPFETPNTSPTPQSAVGPHHYFCRLALISTTGSGLALQDCRTTFPSLTTICADDVCYKSGCDDLKGATTVQQALDQLCKGLSLNFHKKYLHGWGVVCGLEVSCGSDGKSVRISQGYAIDCQGNDILLRTDQTFDVIGKLHTASGVPDGDWSLFFNTSASNALSLEPYTAPSNPTADALSETFWDDFHKTYLQPFADILNQLRKSPAAEIIKNDQRTLSAVINLVMQRLDPSYGSNIYISHSEHDLLLNLYKLIRSNLHDRTLCSLLAGLPEPPAYPQQIDGTITGYGQGSQKRLRVLDTGQLALATGSGSSLAIHLYTLQGQAPLLQRILSFPAASGQHVTDCIFSLDRQSVYAIATDGSTSTFGILQFTNVNAAWATCTVPSSNLHTLAILGETILATGVGSGVYRFTLTNIAPSAKLDFQCSSIGSMVSAQGAGVFLAARASEGTGHIVLNLNFVPSAAGLVQVANHPLPAGVTMTADDDIAFTPEIQAGRIYVTATNGPNSARVIALVDLFRNPSTWLQYNVPDGGTLRLAASNQFQSMLFCSSRQHDIWSLTETAGTAAPVLNAVRLFPTETAPTALAASDRRGVLLALNSGSSTLSFIPVSQLAQITPQQPWTATQWNALRQYRVAMYDAFLHLGLAFTQYLKDAFCELLLLQCRVCDEENKPVYLATISVRSGAVYKTCNLQQRRYVKTFPGVEYWLSIVPVVPMMELFLKQLCCAALTIPKSFELPDHSSTLASTSSGYDFANLHNAVQTLASSNLKPAAFIKSVGNRFASSRTAGSDYLSSLLRPSTLNATEKPSISSSAITGIKVEAVQAQLAQSNVKVDVQSYDPADIRVNLIHSFSQPTDVAPGTQVTLYADSSGTVKAYSVPSSQLQQMDRRIDNVAHAQVDVTHASANIATLNTQLSEMKEQIASLRTTHAQELAVRDAQIAQLTTNATQLASTLNELNTKVGRLNIPNA